MDADARLSHPAPRAGSVPARRSLLLLGVGPLAWWLQESLAYAAASHHCAAGGSTPLGAWIAATTLAAALIGAIAAALAWRDWHRSRDEREGKVHDLVEVGEGRARFLALLGVLTNVGFATAAAFLGLALLAVQCGR